jgi:hypothetical protein
MDADFAAKQQASSTSLVSSFNVGSDLRPKGHVGKRPGERRDSPSSLRLKRTDAEGGVPRFRKGSFRAHERECGEALETTRATPPAHALLY